MSAISHSYHSRLSHKRLHRHLPEQKQDLRQIHDIHFALIVSAVIVTAILMALAWMVTNRERDSWQVVSPLQDIAQVVLTSDSPARAQSPPRFPASR